MFHLCYIEDKHPLQASLTINGICYLYPEASRSLPRSWRCNESFSKLTVLQLGKPVGLETLVCMEDWLRQRKGSSSTTAADMIVVGTDGYLREQDMFNLRAEDLAWSLDRSTVSAHFGRAARGDSSKTGREQGVVFDEPYTMAVLKRRTKGLAHDELVFKIKAEHYRRWWRAAARAVLGSSDKIGPPHSVRHTGASRDLATGYRTFAQVQRRGRWKASDSVQRYARPHVWQSVTSEQPQHVIEQGRALLAQRVPRAAVAKE